MPKGSIYSNHTDQRGAVVPSAKLRIKKLGTALEKCFERHIEYRKVPFILWDKVSPSELANAFSLNPVIIKSILASVNVAQRAIKRDLGIDINTYTSQLTPQKAAILAGYIKPLLPKEVAIPALLLIDEHFWIDKEMRAKKGRWEKQMLLALNNKATITFEKRKFKYQGADFELDAAYTSENGAIEVGVDVKRFESPRDFHKRGDEITQKAEHLKRVYPDSKFYALIYYPFPSKHHEVKARYENNNIDAIYFAGESPNEIKDAANRILLLNDLLKR